MVPKLEGGGRMVMLTTLIFVALSTIAFGLRLWARLLIRAWGLDDWLLLVGWALFLIQPVVIPFSRIGSHFSQNPADVRPSLSVAEYEEGRKWHFFIGLLYTVNTTVIKCSICCLMLRIARERVHRWVFKGVIYISVMSALIRIVVWVARCKNLEEAWRDHTLANETESTCGSPVLLTDVSIFFSVICIATDLICAILPAVIVYKLQLSWKQRMCIAVLLGLGIIASIATIIRVQYLFRYQDDNDFLVKLVPIAFHSNFEVTLGIVAACIATWRPLLRYLPSWLGADMASYGSSNSHKLRHLRTNQGGRNDDSASDSQALMLPLALPGAKIKDEIAKHV